MKISAILPEFVDHYWEHAAPLIERALGYSGERKIEDVHAEVTRYGHLLWVAHDEQDTLQGAAVTNIVQYPVKRVLLLEYLGAKPEIMKHFLDEVMYVFKCYAHDLDCASIEIRGRLGWSKVLTPYGAKVVSYIYELPPGDYGFTEIINAH